MRFSIALVFALWSTCSLAASQYTVSVYEGLSFDLSKLRVNSLGKPEELLLPNNLEYSSFGWQVGDVNSSGLMVASRLLGGGTSFFRAFVYDLKQGWPSVPIRGLDYVQGLDINDRGDILAGYTETGKWVILPADGSQVTLSGYSYRRPSLNDDLHVVGDDVLWVDGTATPLDNLVRGPLPWVGHIVTTDINDQGMIAAYGLSVSGKLSAFVLTPIPEPTIPLTMTVGLLGLLAVFCRRSGQ